MGFAKEGCKLAITARNQERLDQTAAECQKLGVSKKDVSSKSDIPENGCSSDF